MAQNKMIMIIGVTASGKASLAFELAKKHNAEIISIDSMKIYRRMNIGTAKPSAEKQAQIPYHLIDVVEPSQSFSVGKYLEQTNEAIDNIKSRGKNIVAVGGTALYVKSLLFGLFDGPESDESLRKQLNDKADDQGLDALYNEMAKIDPDTASKVHPNDRKRIIRALEVFQLTGKPISSFQQQWNSEHDNRWTLLGLRREKDLESQRINARVKKMMELGLLDEVKTLLAEPKPLSKQAASAIGYTEIISHLNGDIDLETAVEKIKINTRRLAKQQRTWFKTFTSVSWIQADQTNHPDEIITTAENIIQQ